MRKIIRIILKLILLIFIFIGILFIISEVLMNRQIPVPIQLTIFIMLIGFAIAIGIELLSNPTQKMKLPKIRRNKIRKKEKTIEFKEICEQIMNTYGLELEGDRKEATKYIKILCLVWIVLTMLTIIITKFITIKISLLIVFYLLFSIPLLYLIEKKKKTFYEKYKKNVIRMLVKHIYEEATYNCDGNEEMCSRYIETKFTDEEYNTLESTDYISATINQNIKIQLCKVSLLNCNSSGEVTNTVDTFLFGYNQVNFTSPVEITIKRNRIMNWKEDIVQLDNEEFEKCFDVVSDSHMIALQILTHDVMEELVYFYKKYGIDFQIYIKKNQLYIKFETGNVFNPSLFKKVVDNDLLWIYYNIWNFTIALSYKINKALENLQL